MPTITLKKADLNDLTSIQQLGQQTFMETFASENTPENIAQYLEKSFNTPQLTSELQNPESQFYLAFGTNSLLVISKSILVNHKPKS